MANPYCSMCAQKIGGDIVKGHNRLVKLTVPLKNGTEVFVCKDCDMSEILVTAAKNYPPTDE